MTPDFIKLDVEGAEPLVLDGAESILETDRPKLLIEVHTEQKLNDFGRTQADVYQTLNEYEYELTRHDTEGERNGHLAGTPPDGGDRHHLFAVPADPDQKY
jgi:hypothetical protein